MKITKSTVEKLVISELKNFDPVFVLIEDFGPGAGKITITQFGEAWTAFWSHMGEQNTMRSFFLKASHDYLIRKLSSGIQAEVPDNDQDRQSLVLKVEIVRQRRHGEISRDEARNLWDLAEGDLSYGSDLCEAFGSVFGYDEWWGHLPKKPNHKYQHLREIVEVVKQALKQEGEIK